MELVFDTLDFKVLKYLIIKLSPSCDPHAIVSSQLAQY